jgi:MFS family permease
MAWGVVGRHADFRRLFVGNAVSLLGSSVTTVALPLTAVLYLHASPLQMGLLGAAAMLPHLVLGLPVGVWVSRLPYRRVLVVSDLAQTVLLGSIPVLAALGQLRMWHLYAVVGLAGAAGLFEIVALQSFTPMLLPPEDLFAGNSAYLGSFQTINTSGPATAGLLVTAFGAPVSIAVDAVSFLVAAVFKSRIRHPGRSPASRAAAPGIGEGLRALLSHRLLRPLTLAATVGAFANQAQAVVLVLFLVRELHLPPWAVGVAVAISGAAGVIGAVVVGRFTRRVGPGWAHIGGMLLASTGGLVLAAAGPLALVVVGQLMRGAAPSLFGVNQQTLRQTLVSPERLAQVNASWRFLVFGFQSLGALVGGLLASAAGLRSTLVATSCLMLTGMAISIASPLRSLRSMPVPGAA